MISSNPRKFGFLSLWLLLVSATGSLFGFLSVEEIQYQGFPQSYLSLVTDATLSLEDISLWEDGVPVEVTYWESREYKSFESMEVILVLDNSLSMKDRVEPILEAFEGFLQTQVSAVRPSRFAVVGFSDLINTVWKFQDGSYFTRDSEILLGAIRDVIQYRSSRSPKPLEVLDWIWRNLDYSADALKLVLFFSDECPPIEQLNGVLFQSVLENYRNSRMKCYIFYDLDGPSFYGKAYQLMAQGTGGELLDLAKVSEELGKPFLWNQNVVKTRVMAWFQSHIPFVDGAEHTIGLQLGRRGGMLEFPFHFPEAWISPRVSTVVANPPRVQVGQRTCISYDVFPVESLLKVEIELPPGARLVEEDGTNSFLVEMGCLPGAYAIPLSFQTKSGTRYAQVVVEVE